MLTFQVRLTVGLVFDGVSFGLISAHALSMRRKCTVMSVCARIMRIKGNVRQSRECVNTTWRVEFLVHRGSNAEVAADGGLGPPDSYLTRLRIFHCCTHPTMASPRNRVTAPLH